jgi:hypothetical protein
MQRLQKTKKLHVLKKRKLLHGTQEKHEGILTKQRWHSQESPLGKNGTYDE